MAYGLELPSILDPHRYTPLNSMHARAVWHVDGGGISPFA